MQHSDEHPPLETRLVRGKLWVQYPDNPDLIFLGTAPVPRNAWETFVYHVCHGMIMRYPLRDVLIWSWKNRHSFKDD